MSDLTHGSISRHLISMAGFIAAGLVFQSAYFVIDLYFVSRLGKDAVAGVSSAGNFFYLALAGAQLAGVGALSLISQAIGRKDGAYANLVFNQVLALSFMFSAAALVLGYALAGVATAGLSASSTTAAYGRAYLFAYLPSLAGLFPGTVMMAGLRALGVAKPTMVVQTGSVLANVVLAPILIAGWGTGYPLGAFGAGLASSLSSLGSLAVLAAVWPRLQSQLRVRRAELAPRLAVWASLMRIGLPAAGEFFVMFVTNLTIYWALRRFGPVAQAGYGIGARVMQALFLPTMAISFAAAPIAGQNFGAGNRARVLQTFRTALFFSGGVMVLLTLVCQTRPDILCSLFTQDPAVLVTAARFLQTVSWNFVAIGIVFSCSGMFQAVGDTRPSFISSSSRLVTFALPCVLLSHWQPAVLADFWLASNIAAFIQAAFSLWLLRRLFLAKRVLTVPRNAEVGVL